MRKSKLTVFETALIERREHRGGAHDESAGDRSATGDTAAGHRFAVTRLTLTGFRSYASLRLATDGAPVVLTGANGAGKTNLLESISYLAPGRGLRRARMAEVTRRHGNGDGRRAWAVAAALETPQGRVEIGTGSDPERAGQADGAGERRIVRIDGVAAAGQAALARVASVTWLTPEMDGLFLGPASARRRFLDRLVYGFVPDHAGRTNAYERAMRGRARLLREPVADPAWLSALETSMAESGVAIAAARRDVVGRLASASGLGNGAFPRPAMAVAGTVEGWLDEVPALAAEERFRALLAGSRALDAVTGGAADGPQRSDLVVRHRDKDLPAALCSTGEQKALLVALVLATARLQALDRGGAPILLLDEVVAHLDEARREALFDEVCGLGAQAWMTGADAVLFDGMRGRARFLAVADGRVAELSED